MNTRSIGRLYEDIAADYLTRKGYRILERNFQIRGGELDLVCLDSEPEPCVVFVEVKYQTFSRYGCGQEHVHRAKQQKLMHCAEVFLLRRRMGTPVCRFDVVAIDGEGNITHIQNAFER